MLVRSSANMVTHADVIIQRLWCWLFLKIGVYTQLPAICDKSSRWFSYVIVSVRASLVPPLVQPRLPEFPLGVWMVTLAVPGPVMSAVVSVTRNWELLRTWVLSVVPSITTTEDDTM